MNAQASSGVWEVFVPISQGAAYKFHIRSRYHMYTVDKADPFALHNEVRRAPLPSSGPRIRMG